MYRTVGKFAWRIWLAVGLLIVGTSFASDPAIVWRFIGCIALIWVPVLVIDHMAGIMQDVIDYTARDLDDRDALIWAAIDGDRPAEPVDPDATILPQSRVAGGGAATPPTPETPAPMTPLEPMNVISDRAAEQYAASAGQAVGSHEYGTAIIDPVTEQTAVMDPVENDPARGTGK